MTNDASKETIRMIQSTEKRRRPAVVTACTIVLGFSALTNLYLLVNLIFDTYTLIQSAMTVTCFVCLLVRAHSQITYYLTSTALALIVFKWLDAAVRFRGHIPPLPPDSPFSRILMYSLALGMCLLA